MDIACYL